MRASAHAAHLPSARLEAGPSADITPEPCLSVRGPWLQWDTLCPNQQDPEGSSAVGPTSAVTDLPKEIAAQAWAETRSPTAEPALVELQLRALTAAARYKDTHDEPRF